MRACLCLVALLLLAAPARAQAPAGAQQPDSILVLDASGSMWGRVDGRPKIAIARDAVAALAAAWPAGARLGLVAYGHRRPADCADIETVAPLGAQSAAALAERVRAIVPRGRTPLGDAVRHAAQELGWRERPARVILVSDGIENCRADPCAVGRELRASGRDFVVHVVGFDVADPRDQQQLRCLAEATGGRFVPASSAAELATALAAVTATAPPAPPSAAPATPPPPAAETNLTLEAAAVEAGPAIPGGVWTLTALGPPPRAVIANDGRAAPALRVPPGRYEVQVRSGNARVTERFAVAGARQTYRVVLNIGTLRLEGALAAGQAATGGGTWDVLADEVPGYRPGETAVANNGTPQPVLRLVQGSYRVRYRWGQAEAAGDVYVPAGGEASLRLDLAAARVTLVAARAGQPVAASWEVRRDGSTAALAASGAARGQFILPAGRYVARARVGTQWFEQPFEAVAGSTPEVTVVLP
jgi:Ca-activated chloride channel family protein